MKDNRKSYYNRRETLSFERLGDLMQYICRIYDILPFKSMQNEDIYKITMCILKNIQPQIVLALQDILL